MRTTTITSNIIIIPRCRLIIILSSGDPRRDCTTTCSSYDNIVIAEFLVTRSAAHRCGSKRFIETSGRDLGAYSAIE